MATTGLNFVRSPYDEANYRRILELVSGEFGRIFGLTPADTSARFQKELGYVTTKVGVNAAIFREDGRMLLERRADDGCWGIPGGWVDVNETPETAIEREVMEEASLVARPKKLIHIFSRNAGDFGQPHSSCHILYLCQAEPGEPRKSHESLDLGYFALGEVKEWHRDHRDWAEKAVACHAENSN